MNNKGKRCSNCKWWKRTREKWTGRFLDGGHCHFEPPKVFKPRDDYCLNWVVKRQSHKVHIDNYGTPTVDCANHSRDVYGDHGCVTCKFHDRVHLGQYVYCFYTEDMSDEDIQEFNVVVVRYL